MDTCYGTLLTQRKEKQSYWPLPKDSSYSEGQPTLTFHSTPERKTKNKVPPVRPSLDLEVKQKGKLMVSATLRVLVFSEAMVRYHFNMRSFHSAGVFWKAWGSPHKLGAALNIRDFPLKISHYFNALRNVSTLQTEMWLPAARLLLSHTTRLLVFPAQPQLFWLLHQHHRKWIIYTTYWI